MPAFGHRLRPSLRHLACVTVLTLLPLMADPANPSPPAAGKPARKSTEPTLDIDVRSAVDRPFQGLGKAPPKDHGRVYAIAAINLAPSAVKLVRPVDESRMLQLLGEELARRGFRPVRPDEKPEIIITVTYGRGWLKNPYMSYMTEMPNSEVGSGNVVSISGASPHFLRSKEFRFEDKLQKANYEKIFIRVTAWAYPEPAPPPAPGAKKRKKPKLHELWKTDMIVDDPDHRDLNLFIKEMLAAGGTWFDREIEKEEVTVSTDIPEGRVILAPLKFLEDPGTGGKTGAKPPPAKQD